MSAVTPIRELRRVFRASTSGGIMRWRRIIANDWYQTQLSRTASALLRRYQAPADLRDQLARDAMMLLRDDLLDTSELGLDLRSDAAFVSTAHRLIARHCLRALPSLQGKHKCALRSTATAQSPVVQHGLHQGNGADATSWRIAKLPRIGQDLTRSCVCARREDCREHVGLRICVRSRFGLIL